MASEFPTASAIVIKAEFFRQSATAALLKVKKTSPNYPRIVQLYQQSQNVTTPDVALSAENARYVGIDPGHYVRVDAVI